LCLSNIYYYCIFFIDTSEGTRDEENVKVKFETLRAMEQAETIDIDSHMSDRVSMLSSLLEILTLFACNFNIFCLFLKIKLIY
jgi:hypothetical protein